MPDSLHPVSEAPESVAPDSDFELGRSALLEITSAESIGAPAGSIDEGDGVTTVYFETLLAGYPGWRWTASIAHVQDTPASVLETELTPGDTALLSPAWVPWVDRLADYTAAQDVAGEGDTADDATDGLDDDDSDDDDNDDDDNDDDDDEEGPYPYAVQDNISVQSCHRAASVGDTMLRIKYRKSIRIRETTLQRQSDSRRRVE